jgi:hypothetical protein
VLLSAAYFILAAEIHMIFILRFSSILFYLTLSLSKPCIVPNLDSIVWKGVLRRGLAPPR